MIYLLGFSFVFVFAVFAKIHWDKSRIECSGQVQCGSGDQEVMVFNYNFLKGETEAERQYKVNYYFQKVQDRRDENHEKWLKIKAQAIEENEKAESEGKSLKLKSVTEGK